MFWMCLLYRACRKMIVENTIFFWQNDFRTDRFFFRCQTRGLINISIKLILTFTFLKFSRNRVEFRRSQNNLCNLCLHLPLSPTGRWTDLKSKKKGSRSFGDCQINFELWWVSFEWQRKFSFEILRWCEADVRKELESCLI